MHLSTWTTADGSCLWPETWLVEAFPDAHVLCVGYHYQQLPVEHSGLDLYHIGEILLTEIVNDAKIGQIPHCPVILVGHSVGGLVIKHVCSMANRFSLRNPKFRIFLQNVKAISFYSTPHCGVSISPKRLRLFNISESLVGALLPLSTETTRLNEEFRQISDHFKWSLVGFGETEKTELVRIRFATLIYLN